MRAQLFLRFASLLCLPLFAQSAFGQLSGTGLDQFGTFQRNHVQTMNLFNLNNHIEFPLFAKKERGVNFNAKLVWDQSDSLQFVQVSYPPGGQYFQVNGPRFASVTDVYYNSHLVGSQTCSPNTSAVTTYFDSIVDQDNTVHAIPTGASVTTGQYCGSGTYKVASSDGKWLLTITWTDQNCWGEGCITSVTETDTSGNVYGYNSGLASLTDPNGNQITVSGAGGSNETWTDPTGNTVFTAQQPTPPQPTMVYSYPVQTGGMAQVQLNYTSGFTLQNQFGCNLPYQNTSAGLPTSVSLPDGTSYSFVYESANGTYPSTTITGRIHSITVPAGGTWTYTYSGGTNGINCTGTPGSPATIIITGSDGSVWTYNRTIVANCPGGICQPGPWSQTVVTDPACNDTVYEFGADGTQMQAQSYQGTAGTAACSATTKTLLQTVTTCYNGNFTNCGTAPGTGTCTNPGGPCRIDIYTYFPGLSQPSLSETFYNSAELVTQQNEFDFGVNTGSAPTTTPLRATKTTYASIGNNILNRPSCVQVTGGTSPSTCGTITSTTKSLTKYLNYDSHGNVGTIQQRVSGSTYISQSLTYFSTGLVHTATDFNSNQTTYTYGACNNSYLTSIAEPLNLSRSMTWDCNGGVLTSATDENGKQTQYSYTNPASGVADPFWRMTRVTYPDGGQTTTTYNDTASPVNVSTTQLIDNSGHSITAQTNFDSFGRSSQSLLTSDPDGTTYTATTYDALGRSNKVYNPTRCNPPTTNCGESTWGYTTYAYDALSRTTQITNPDNSTVLTSYTGRATQVSDEGNGTQRVTRISQADALGRLTSVCEITNISLIGGGGTPSACGQDISATGFLTTYQYDALGNLLQVNQSGVNPRTFGYDSLSRLTSANNPESGTTTYTYDSDASCPTPHSFPGLLVSKRDARGIRTCMQYDALNRLTGKTYSDGTPAATFSYDQSSALGVTLTNTKGRKSSQSTAGPNATGSVFSYDPMGRVVDNSQCTPQNCGTGIFAFQYTQYDFLGDLLSATNATGVTFTDSYNTAARLIGINTNFVDGSHPGTLFSNAHYGPFGGLTSATLGNGVTESWSYNNRLRQQSRTTTFGATTPYTFNVATFAPNGNILAANDSANGNWTYTYDSFNRLLTANASGQAYTYDYDRYGNRWHQNGPHSSQLGFDANNRITGVTGVGYDLAGNLTSDGSGAGSHSYFYDAENRLIQVDGTLGTCSTATACYVYDAEGRRVRKTTASGTLDFLYDVDGHKVAEVDPTGVFMRGELYASGRHFAVYAPEPGPTGATFFTHGNWLGTERVRTDMTGTPCETITSLAFGDGQIISGNCNNSSGDVSPMHFTGKERDFESGLDNFGARYDSSSLGRFMSPDPDNAGASEDDPQSWNAYSYVFDNPLNLTDPDGLGPCDNNPNQCIVVTVDPPGPIDPFFFRLSDELSKVAQRSSDLLHTAWDFWVNSKPNSGCVATATTAGAVGGAVIGGKSGATLGAAAGATGGTFALPGGGTIGGGFGGAALGGTAGTIAGAGIGGAGGWLVGQVACRTASGVAEVEGAARAVGLHQIK